jgi:cytoskeletal protein RodZ
MKRCPECDFIYEDNQRLCDMDGIALVHDSTFLPDDSTVILAQPQRPMWRQLMLALSVVVLAGLGLYVFNYPATAQRPVSSLVANASDSVPQATSVDAGSIRAMENSADDSDSKDESESVRTGSSGAAKAIWPTISPNSRAPATSSKPQLASRRVNTVYSPAKRESKIGSFLKKTRRILKKPFTR